MLSIFLFQKFSLEQRISDLSSAPDYDRAADFIDAVVQDFRNEVTDKVVIIMFINVKTQEMRVRELLPIGLENVEAKINLNLEIEPDDDEEILDELANKYIDFNMYALIDSFSC